VCLSVRKVYYGKAADWIRMPFAVVSGVGRGMGVLDGGGDRRREAAVLGVDLGEGRMPRGAATRSSQITLREDLVSIVSQMLCPVYCLLLTLASSVIVFIIVHFVRFISRRSLTTYRLWFLVRSLSGHQRKRHM